MAARWLETSSASTALGSPSSWQDPESDSDDSGTRSWSSETSSLSRWVLTLNDGVRANDPDLRPTESFIDVEDPGARDPDVRGEPAIDRANRFAVPESIGPHCAGLPSGHSVFNKDLVPKDVIDRGVATSAYLDHMKQKCNPCVLYASREGCKQGINCRYCHFEHPAVELSHRIRKTMRDKIKRRLAPLCVQDADLEAVHDDLQTEAAKHPLARIRIQMMAVDLAACGRRLAALALAESPRSPRQLQEALATSVNFTVKVANDAEALMLQFAVTDADASDVFKRVFALALVSSSGIEATGIVTSRMTRDILYLIGEPDGTQVSVVKPDGDNNTDNETETNGTGDEDEDFLSSPAFIGLVAGCSSCCCCCCVVCCYLRRRYMVEIYVDGEESEEEDFEDDKIVDIPDD